MNDHAEETKRSLSSATCHNRSMQGVKKFVKTITLVILERGR